VGNAYVMATDDKSPTWAGTILVHAWRRADRLRFRSRYYAGQWSASKLGPGFRQRRQSLCSRRQRTNDL